MSTARPTRRRADSAAVLGQSSSNVDERTVDGTSAASISAELSTLSPSMMKRMAELYFEGSRMRVQKEAQSNQADNKMPSLEPHSLLPAIESISSEINDVTSALESKAAAEQFDSWLKFLAMDFNILLYGYGSKYDLIARFCAEKLHDISHVVLLGYHPDACERVFVRQVFNCLKLDLPTGREQYVDALATYFAMPDAIDLILVVHNIDALRSRHMQQLFCTLVQRCSGRIHILASIDNIRAPLMWDSSQLSQLNFVFKHVSTQRPYTRELVQQDTLLVSSCTDASSSTALASLRSVWASLTQNSRQIFALLVVYCLSKREAAEEIGMPFRALYAAGRDAFLVNSEASLKAQLVEFRDHDLVQSTRSSSGSEVLMPTMDLAALRAFLAAQGLLDGGEADAADDDEAENSDDASRSSSDESETL